MKEQKDKYKKRTSKRLYEEVKKHLTEKCDQLCEELDKPFIRHKELIVEKEKIS